MARVNVEQSLLPSILDRLIDHEPRNSSESQAQRSPPIAQVKAAVKRDLEWLLNTKQLVADRPADLRALSRSLLTYGMPDFTSSRLSNTFEQDRLRRVVEESIAQFEPRLTEVKVSVIEGKESDRSLRFRIDALLRAEPSPEPVTFDSVLQLSTRAFVVQGE
jgi:type VI secretion system protein ImpF